MNGTALFDKYTQRDFSGSVADEYAQTLMTIWSQIGADIYPLLERANMEHKTLSIAADDKEMLDDTITVDDVILV